MATSRRQILIMSGGLVGATWLAACGLGSAPRPRTEASDLLMVSTDRGLAALQAGRTEPIVPAGPSVAGADWARLFATGSDGEGTRLRTIETATGAEVASATVPGALVARVIAPSGHAVAMTEPTAGVTPYAPVPRDQTTIVVVDPAGKRPALRLELDGNYEPEAFATGDHSLFVIQHLPALAPDRYRVRICDLTSGVVGPLATRIKTPVPVSAEEEMRGDGRQAVLAPNHRWLYTLYTNQPDHLHTRDRLAGRRGGDGQPVHAFVHVLNLYEGWAFCLDLPAPFGQGHPAAHTLALTPDGRWLFVADLTSGRLAIADTESLQIQRTVVLDSAAINATAAAVVTRDGGRLYLGGGQSVLALGSDSLRIVARWPVGSPIHGLAPSGDGQRLYVGQEGRVIGLNTDDGREFSRLTVPGLTSLRHVR